MFAKLKRKYRGQAVVGLMMVLPTIAVLAVLKYYPAIMSFFYSFTRWNGFDAPRMIGLRNYAKLLTDKVFAVALKNVSIWTVVYSLQCLIPPLLAAELIFHLKSTRGQYAFRVALAIPMVIPEIVNQLIWQLIYDGDGGMLNRFLTLIGLERFATNWLGSSSTALWSLMLMGFPWIHAFNMLLFFAGLQNISKDVLESATLDGLGTLGKIWKIHIPYLMNQFKIAIILAIIACLQSITASLNMTSGGPGYATYTPALHMYLTAFSSSNFGYSCAISVVMFIIVLIFTILSNRIQSQTDYEA